MENLFVNALDAETSNKIETLKKNKAFALKLHSHLDAIYYTYHEIEDGSKLCTIWMKSQAYYNLHGAFSFVADLNGVHFKANNILAFDNAKVLPTILKYKDVKGFHKWNGNSYSVIIPLDENDLNLKEKLQDIIKLCEHQSYNKKL